MSTPSIPQKRERHASPNERERLFEHSLSLVCVGGFDGYPKRINRAVSAVLGYTEEEITSIPILDLVHPDDLALAAEKLEGLANGQGAHGIEVRVAASDGSYRWILWDSVSSLEEQEFVTIGHDITSLRAVEGELRESQERFRLAAKATRDVIWDWDIRKGRVWRSEVIETFLGYPRASITNDLEWWLERIHPDDRERAYPMICEAIATGRDQYSCEYRFRRADGTYADVLDRGFVMNGADGKAVRMVGSLTDISERRRAQETLLLQQAELAHVARVNTMGEIATGLAHELNQPLAAIANYAESCTQAMVSRTPPNIDKLLGWIEKIASNTHRAGEIVRRLRAFTRKSEPRRTSVAVNDLVREVIELIEPETRRRNMRLRWEPTEAMKVIVDHVQIQQVLVNLLNNAYEAAADMPSERRLVTIEAAPAGDVIQLCVADSGHGVADEHRDRVFDAFFTTKSSGVGIGLAISRSIVEDHGGRLWLAANPRHGVTFHFTLPTSEVRNGRTADRNGRG